VQRLVSRTSSKKLTCSDTGFQNTVTLTVTDVGGNEDMCTSTVQVFDKIPPTAACENITLSLDGSGNGSISVTQIGKDSADACGITSREASQTAFNCREIG